MTDKVVEVVHGDGGGSGALMGVAVVLLIAVVMLILYFTGVFGRAFDNKKEIDVDVNINKPGIVLMVR